MTPENATQSPAAGSAAPAATQVALTPLAPATAPATASGEGVKIEQKLPAAHEPLQIETIQYEPTGDDGLDLALEFVGNLGIGPEHEAMKAASNGDFSAIEKHLAGLGDKAKGYQRLINIAKKSFEQGAKAHAEQAAAAAATEEKTKAAIYAAMGGPENWPAVQTWAASAATDEEKTEVAAAFKAGGQVAVAMAERLARLYKKAGGTFAATKSAVKDGASAHAPSTTKLDGKEYASEVAKARRAYRGGDFDSSPEYKSLQARRR